jgi:hypothetical protein
VLGGLQQLRARQESPRGGDLLLELKPGGRVGIAGPAAVVIEGTFYLPSR